MKSSVHKHIGSIEIYSFIANMVIGFGVLNIPRNMVQAVKSVDGWISIVLGGLVAVFFTWIIAKLMNRFSNRNLYQISESILNKPMAIGITILFALHSLLFVSYETRGVTSISRLYLFDRTPVEVICLVFLLVLIYAVAGHSIPLIRLNIIFLPIVIGMLAILFVMNITFFNWQHLRPFFTSNVVDIVKASKDTVTSFLGFEIMFFYNMFIQKNKRNTRAALFGIIVPLLLYVLVFFFVVGVFGVYVTGSTLYPTAELAKEVQVPGGFFERFESIFFSVWVITLFMTAAMALDVSLLALESVFKKVKRMTLILILAPLLYLTIMQPVNLIEIMNLGEFIGYSGIVIGMILPFSLLVVAKIRGVKGDES